MNMFNSSLHRFTDISLNISRHKTGKSFGVLHARLNTFARDILQTYIKKIRPLIFKKSAIKSAIWGNTSSENIFPAKCYMSSLFLKVNVKYVGWGLFRKAFTGVIADLNLESPYAKYKEDLHSSCYHGIERERERERV